MHGDVFRFPPGRAAFAAAAGAGAQALAAAACLAALGAGGAFVPHSRGALASAALLIYPATGAVAGYVAARLYTQASGGRAGRMLGGWRGMQGR